MKVIKGDILNVEKGIIIHQANNKRVMGAGVAKVIITKYPKHKKDYMNSAMKLGNIVRTKVNDNLSIIAMITQDGYGRDKNTVYTDYVAFENALCKLRRMKELRPNRKFYMPYNIGCGLANGDWNKIYKLIDSVTPFVILIRKE